MAPSPHATLPALRFLRRSLLFASSLCVTLMLVENAVGALTYSPFAAKYQELFAAKSKVPNIILGTSHAVYGIDPSALEQTGRPFYNFAFNGSDPLFYLKWYPLLKRYYRKPDYVLFAVDWFMFEKGNNRRIEHDSSFFPPGVLFGLLSDRSVSLPRLLKNRFSIVRERDSVRERLLGEEPERHYLMPLYHRGYAPFRTPVDLTHGPVRRPDNPRSVAAFRELLSQLKQDGVKVVFVEIPEYLPVSGTHAQDDRRLASFAAEYGIPFLNYNGERRSAINEDPSLFFDWGHLNENGCARFSWHLAADLLREHLLPEREGARAH